MGRSNPFRLPQKAVRLVAAPPLYSDTPLSNPDAAIRVMTKELRGYDREVLCVINLQTDMKPINFSIVSMGVLNKAVIHPREMLKNTFLSNAAGIIILHNHPSGRLEPSEDDIGITDRMNQLCKLAGIDLFDHIIVSGRDDGRYYSMRQNSCMKIEDISFETKVENLKWEMAAESMER